ncbi:MAG TPA: site-2 protease family protein [Myxococcota bacterium]|nr:site-2 protease family protein [Myxococcota bacterium]
MSEPVLVRAAIRTPRSTWAWLPLSVLFALVGAWGALFDGAGSVALYPLGGAAAFGLFAWLSWLGGGEIELTQQHFRWRFRARAPREVALADVVRAELRGRDRTDNLRLRLKLRSGRVVRIHRPHPEQIVYDIQQLIGQQPPPAPPPPYDEAGRRLPERKPASWRWLAWVGMFAVLSALAGLAGQANGWAAFNVALFVVLWALMVVAHELGHAVAARLTGFDVHWISIGTGPRVASFHVAGVRVDLFAVPFSGACFSTTSERADLRRRDQIVSAAGPFVNVLAGAVGFAVLYVTGLGPYMEQPAPLAMFTLANLLVHLGQGPRGDGLRTDLIEIGELARASEEEMDRRFRASLEQNQLWSTSPDA